MSDHTIVAIWFIKTFLYSSSVYSGHLFLISSPSVDISILYRIYFVLNVSLVSLISLKGSLGFPILLFSSIYLHCSLKKAFLFLLAIIWNSKFRWVYLCFSPLPFTFLLFSIICKCSSENHFAFLHFFFLQWFWSPAPVQ